MSIESSGGLTSVTELPSAIVRPRNEDVFNTFRGFLVHAKNLGATTLGEVWKTGHDMVHGGYDSEFLQQFHEQRKPFVSEKGMKLTYRVFNPEFIGNGEHAVVYTFSLAVPGKHGCEVPALEKLALHSRERERPFLAITSPGMAGPVSKRELRLLANFEETPRAMMEGLREILPSGTPLIVTGASWGGMKSYKFADIAPEESKRTGHHLPVTHAIPVVSAGHKQLGPSSMPKIAKQLLIGEPRKARDYVRAGETVHERIKRLCELVGTAPRYPSQVAAILATTVSIMKAPLQDLELQPETSYDDLAFAGDEMTSPDYHPEFIKTSRHPNARSRVLPGVHMDLLDQGVDFMLEILSEIQSTRKPLAA